MRVSEKPLHIDIPVKLTDVKLVSSIGALASARFVPSKQSRSSATTHSTPTRRNFYKVEKSV